MKRPNRRDYGVRLLIEVKPLFRASRNKHALFVGIRTSSELVKTLSGGSSMQKWYIIPYLVLACGVILGAIVVVQQQSTTPAMTIGIVDNDNTTETRMILKSVQQGESFAKGFTLKGYDETLAEQALRDKKIDGYIVLKEGMTRAFYNNGSLPIDVVTYDKDSLQGLLINQLTLSVYDRLMVSEAGILTYGHFYSEASDEKIIAMMLDLLANGLNREAIFEKHQVETIPFADYYVVAGYVLVTLGFFLALLTIFHMNMPTALRDRLRMYPFAEEKLLLARYSLATIYTWGFALLMIAALYVLLQPAFELYNVHYLLITITSFVLVMALLYVVIDVALSGKLRIIAKIIATLLIVFGSGAVIPTMYFQRTWFYNNPFAQLFDALVQLFMTNYVMDYAWSIWLSIGTLIILLGVVLGRRARG